MTEKRFFDQTGRKTIVTGHYGSGKTEFAVSLAMLLAKKEFGIRNSEFGIERVSLIDLDIVNPFFRSRERRDMLEDAGVTVYGSAFDRDVTIELPALSATLRTPLEDKRRRVIVDVGGNDVGAMVLNQFIKYFTDDDTTVFTIINANRPKTSDLEGALDHITAIEAVTGLTVSGIVNNSHLLRETTADVVIKGHDFCRKICEATGKQLWCDCYPDGIVGPEELSGLSGNLMPMGLYMRPIWLDK